MFDFMRKKKDVLSEADAPVTKPKRSRRTSIMLPVGRPGGSKKRERPLSGSFTQSDAVLRDETPTRPTYPRAESSTSSRASFDFRNPFSDDGEPHQMSTSQLDLTQPLDSTAFQPPMANASIRNVARGSPTIVHPPGDHTELFYHVVTEGHETTDPFADESEVPEPVRENRSESTVAEIVPDKERRRSGSLTAVCRKPVDLLRVSIPVTVFTPPLGGGRRDAWTRV